MQGMNSQKDRTLNNTVEISGEAIAAMGLRLLYLMTNYKKPLDFTTAKHEQAISTYRKFIQIAERGEHTEPPVEFLETLCDDLNTSKAISLLHLYAKRKEGDKLFASMLLLGLIPNKWQSALMDLEIKTTPLPELLPPTMGALHG
jgi:cysteinyl-tRNA synthetase